ncbi:acyl-CoA thioesterase [cyanobacterium endosymbiont of Epithemia turgida]|uniref:acyl-CoA thioesterase n=1 Tax=cyanobacterium endosymbiont of Epithemia turgida TaxID=718217 RepID=UPI0004D0EBA3|nr:thioesterase family protein [cyanobacterium endosymbiont of Epithemia turgida]BAP18247.1 putative 4-hydroxybenzoyl-CoA thioesterase [cyanobacterium endosymbiont of Epithemia turgida isolate EtSB Lake Yunoko]
MSSQSQPKLPPNVAISPENILQATTDQWFKYTVRVQPHHTDYSGTVWHGTYLTWIEEARVEYLRSVGIDFAELVKLGFHLPVIELSLCYHHFIQLGQEAIIKTRINQITGVQMNFDCRVESLNTQECYVTGAITLVAVDREKGKIMHHLPPTVRDALINLI